MIDAKIMKKLVKSPLYFVELMWGLKPMKEGEAYERGKHMTPHQFELLTAIENAVNGKGKKRISVRSGHGTGKSTVLSWVVLWYLFTRKNAQVPCTAPTTGQIHDVLWKEVAKWMQRMPEGVAELYEWSNEYIRMKEAPETWFARAKTARKEAPEALAGIHGDHVLFIIDEASGVPNEVFNVAEGALTEEDALVIMISNPTRLVGYFYDSFHSDKNAWECLHFNSEDSPIVDRAYVERILFKAKGDKESDEYRIRVQGEFPKSDSVDGKGYVPILAKTDLSYTQEPVVGGVIRLGVDPSGEGVDETTWVIRNQFHAQIVAREKISDDKGIAAKTLTIMQNWEIPSHEVYIDNFGVGANVAQYLAFAGELVNAVNVGDPAQDEETYMNRRAEAYWRLREWIKTGSTLKEAGDAWEELLTIRQRKELSGKMKMMGKREMRNEGYKSPNIADALMLTFTRKETKVKKPEKELKPWEKKKKKKSLGGRNRALRGFGY